MTCDYCGKVIDEVVELVDMCKTKNCKLVCNTCADKIGKKKNFFMFEMAEKRMKKWIEKTRKTKNDK